MDKLIDILEKLKNIQGVDFPLATAVYKKRMRKDRKNVFGNLNALYSPKYFREVRLKIAGDPNPHHNFYLTGLMQDTLSIKAFWVETEAWYYAHLHRRFPEEVGLGPAEANAIRRDILRYLGL